MSRAIYVNVCSLWCTLPLAAVTLSSSGKPQGVVSKQAAAEVKAPQASQPAAKKAAAPKAAAAPAAAPVKKAEPAPAAPAPAAKAKVRPVVPVRRCHSRGGGRA